MLLKDQNNHFTNPHKESLKIVSWKGQKVYIEVLKKIPLPMSLSFFSLENVVFSKSTIEANVAKMYDIFLL